MDVKHFVHHRRRLFHYTSPHGVDRLRHHGLWPAEELLARYGTAPDRIAELTTFPRFDPVPLDHPDHGPARLSHQRPTLTTRQPLKKLLRSLELGDTTLSEFCQMLARRVFLFPTAYVPGRKSRPAYGFVERVLHDGPLCEVALRTDDLLQLCAEHGLQLELSAHNAGSAPQGLVLPKGRNTWKRIEDFHLGVDRIQEVVVEGSLPPLDGVIDEVRHVRR
ncbi:MAG: hypothetical protein ABIV94_01840 [Acidimicrobiales bacterium]